MASVNQARDEAREYVKLTRLFELNMAFTVTKKIIIEGNVRKDRETKLPMVDNDGNELRYPDRFKLTVSYFGGEVTFPVSKDHYEFVELNEMYLGRGRLTWVTDFGSQVWLPDFSTIELL